MKTQTTPSCASPDRGLDAAARNALRARVENNQVKNVLLIVAGYPPIWCEFFWIASAFPRERAKHNPVSRFASNFDVRTHGQRPAQAPGFRFPSVINPGRTMSGNIRVLVKIKCEPEAHYRADQPLEECLQRRTTSR